MARRTNIVGEFWRFMRDHKAYWMAPIVIALLLLVLFVVLGGTVVAPFIYPIF